MPVEFLSDEQAASYGRFVGPPSRVELERYFFLDDADKELVGRRRGEHNRLGFALQLVTVRFLGTFLLDPLEVPVDVLDYVAEQLQIADPSCVKRYTEREKTRLEHAWEIQREYGVRDFSDAEPELTTWVDARAWTTGDGPKAIFDGAVGWLRDRRVLLPGVTTLARLVARVREEATQRLWERLHGLLSPDQRFMLDVLLEVPDGARTSDWDRLRKGPTKVSGPGMVKALERISQVVGLGLGGLDVAVVPPRRMAELAKYGLGGKTPALKRHPAYRRLATLLASVYHLEFKATDDALELLDLLMVTDLLARAERETNKEKLRRYPKFSKASAKLAAAVEVLFEVTEYGDQISLEQVWESIEAVVPRGELAAAVAAVTDITPPPDADPPSLVDLRDRLAAMLPRVDLPEIILEVMSWQPGFTDAFTAVSGGESRLADLHVSVAAVLTAHALNVGYSPIISPGVPALTRDRLSHVDQNYMRAETYRVANAPLIEAQAEIGLASEWGAELEYGRKGPRVDRRRHPGVGTRGGTEFWR